jgi:hypothetical protein
MATDRHINGEVHNKTDLKKIFTAIRHDTDKASSRPVLTELYKRAGYLITLSHAPSWQTKFGDNATACSGALCCSQESRANSHSPGHGAEDFEDRRREFQSRGIEKGM